MAIYRFPPFEYNSAAGRLRKYGLPIKLQRKPQTVLMALLEEAGKTVTRQELFRRLWPAGTFVDFDPGLSVAVKKLRDALSDSSDTPTYVATVAGIGYRFVAIVEEVANAAPSPTPTPLSLGHPESTPSNGAVALRVGPEQPPSRWRAGLIAFGIALVFALALTFFAASVPPGRILSTRSMIAPPPGWELVTTEDSAAPISLSPDGTRAVFGVRSPKLGNALFLRKIDSLIADRLAGTEGAIMPFWSPDGRKIGFFADQQLKTLSLSDGSIRVVCSVDDSPRGATWGISDVILFAASTRSPILKVAASGGRPVPVTRLIESSFTTHRWPDFLPDGEHFLFLAANHEKGNSSRPVVLLGSLDGHPPQVVVESDSNAIYVGGQLLYAIGDKLLAQSFNPATGRVEDSARILTDTVEYDASLWHATFTATPQLLVYRPRSKSPDTQVIAWLDNTGRVVKTGGRPGVFRALAVAPDGKRVAAVCDDPEMSVCLIHEDGTSTRISSAPISYEPVWSPDGNSLVYGTHRGANRFSLVLKDAQGRKPEDVLLESDQGLAPYSWSSDGRELLIGRAKADKRYELDVLRLADRTLRRILPYDFHLIRAKFAPHGKWIAYQSDETGRDEVYVASYPVPGRSYRLSAAGARAPAWSKDGQELYFLDSSDMIFRVPAGRTEKDWQQATPTSVFRPPIIRNPFDALSFDIVANEPKFAVIANSTGNDSQYVLVTAWSK